MAPAVDPQGDNVKGALQGLLNLAARQFQFREDKIDFFPVKRHPLTVAQTGTSGTPGGNAAPF
jgi:hypothetical protein